MPRRIYEYNETWGAGRLPTCLVDRLLVLALGVLVTMINVARSLKRGAVAGPDPWKGNTLEWFTPSPPPPHNFDVVPRVRSLEPMRDIRRQIEQQTGADQQFQPGRPLTKV
jgi:cytochrome c oxidase subunit 1